MDAEGFAKGLEIYRLLTRLLGKNVENLDDYGCPKFKTLSKRTVCAFALVTFSPTQSKVSLCQEESKDVGRTGYAALVIFVRVYCICVYY